MGIATLGKSLLSSAKKKAKKGQQLGLFAGAAIGVIGAVNKGIRAKAEQRAKNLDKSFVPIKLAAKNFYTEMGTFKGAHDDYVKTGGNLGWEEAIRIEKRDFLKEKFSLSDTTVSPQTLILMGNEESKPDIAIHQAKLDRFKPWLNTTNAEFNTNLALTQKDARGRVSDDSLGKLLGRKFLGSTEGQLVAGKIKLSELNDLVLDLPQKTLDNIDLEFLQVLEGVETRKFNASEIIELKKTIIMANTATTPAELKIKYNSLSKKKALKEIKLENTLKTAFQSLTIKPVHSDKSIEGNKTYARDLEKYMSEITVFLVSNDNKVGATTNLEEIRDELEDTHLGVKIKDASKQQTNDWTLLIQEAQTVAQAEFELRKGKELLQPADFRQIASDSLRKVMDASLRVDVIGGSFFDWNGSNDYQYNTALRTAAGGDPPPEVPVPIVLLRNRIAEYQDNPTGLPSKVLKDIQRMVEELPEYKDEFSVYLPKENKKEETPSPSPTPTPTPALVTTTSKSLLDMTEEEVMDSDAAKKASAEAAAIPGQVVKGVSDFVDANILEDLEEAVVKMKDGKPVIGTSTARVATWLKNTKDISYYKLSKEERIEAIEEYIETLKS